MLILTVRAELIGSGPRVCPRVTSRNSPQIQICRNGISTTGPAEDGENDPFSNGILFYRKRARIATRLHGDAITPMNKFDPMWGSGRCYVRDEILADLEGTIRDDNVIKVAVQHHAVGLLFAAAGEVHV